MKSGFLYIGSLTELTLINVTQFQIIFEIFLLIFGLLKLVRSQ